MNLDDISKAKSIVILNYKNKPASTLKIESGFL